MGPTRKKARLLTFLTRRIVSHGLSQWFWGLRHRDISYLAMDLGEILPGDVRTVIDVGAHAGHVAEALDFLYRPDRLWVVEPNPVRGPELDARFKDRPNVTVAKCCLGEANGIVRFNSYVFDAASSLFSCAEGHLASMGFSEESIPIEVQMTTLRELMPGDLPILDLLKLDCQGSELLVLKGAGDRIRDVRWIYCEVTIDTIYEGAPLWEELHDFLRSRNFVLRSLSGFAGSGRSIQWADALYSNSRLPAD